LHHAHRPLDDPRPRPDHGGRLLLAQHGLGDLRCVGQPGQPRLDDCHRGWPDPVRDLVRQALRDLVDVIAIRLLGLDPRADRDKIHEIVGVQLQAGALA
jgi:hypothetical protein